MTLNTSPADISRQAAIDLARKMILESSFTSQLKDFFDDVNQDFERSVQRNGSTQDVNQYRGRVQGMLTGQSQRVTNSFIDSNINQLRKLPKNNPLKQSLNKISDQLGITLNSLLKDLSLQARLTAQQSIPANVVNSTEQILATTQKQLGDSLSVAREKLGSTATNNELAPEAASVNRLKSAQRPSLISTTLTQQTAELAKFHEQEILINTFNGPEAQQLGLAPVTAETRWVSQSDSLVRDGAVFNHLDADFQVRENGVFRVSGQLLRFPGDTSLGATAANVIRCRCASILTIVQAEDLAA